MDYQQSEEHLGEHVTQMFLSFPESGFPYHNLAHTQIVVTRAKEIASYYPLNNDDLFAIIAAAWFHDTGHLYGILVGHEEKGVELMTAYFRQNPPPSASIVNDAKNCILATKYHAKATGLLEEIICDADTYHFGTIDFRKTDQLVKKEMEMRTGKELLHWKEKALALLNEHVFYTAYCRNLLDEGKKENITWLES